LIASCSTTAEPNTIELNVPTAQKQELLIFLLLCRLLHKSGKFYEILRLAALLQNELPAHIEGHFPKKFSPLHTAKLT